MFWVGRNLEDIQSVIRRITPLMVEVLGSPFQKLKNVILWNYMEIKSYRLSEFKKIRIFVLCIIKYHIIINLVFNCMLMKLFYMYYFHFRGFMKLAKYWSTENRALMIDLISVALKNQVGWLSRSVFYFLIKDSHNSLSLSLSLCKKIWRVVYLNNSKVLPLQ